MWIARVWHCSLFVISRCAEFKHKTEGLYPSPLWRMRVVAPLCVLSVLPDSRFKTDNSPWHSAVHSPLSSGSRKGEWVLPEPEMDDGPTEPGPSSNSQWFSPRWPVQCDGQRCHPVHELEESQFPHTWWTTLGWMKWFWISRHIYLDHIWCLKEKQ